MFLLIIISMVVTKVFGNLHGAVDTLIVETDYGNVSSWEVGSYANLKSVQIPKSWRNPSNWSICHCFTIQFMENWLNLLQRWEASPKWWWGKSSTCSLEYHMPNPPLEVEGLLITSPYYFFFQEGKLKLISVWLIYPRFRKPEKVSPWEGVLDGTKMPNTCIQVVSMDPVYIYKSRE